MGSEKVEEPSLATLLEEIRCVRTIVTETKDGLTGVCARLDKVEPEVVSLRKEVVSLRKEVVMLKEERTKEREERTKERSEKLKEQKYSRRKNVIISGIPAVDEEDTDALVTELAQGLGLILRPFDLVVSHRLPTAEGIPDIIAQFFTVRTKFELVRRAKKHKLQLHGVPIYVSEHLTATTKWLLKAAKQLKKAKLIQFVWTSNGNLFVRRVEGEPAQKIEALTDLERFGWKNPTSAATNTASQATTMGTLGGSEKRNNEQRSPDDHQQRTANFNKKFNWGGAQGGNRPRVNSTGQTNLRNFGQFSRGSAVPVAGGALSQALSQNSNGA